MSLDYCKGSPLSGLNCSGRGGIIVCRVSQEELLSIAPRLHDGNCVLDTCLAYDNRPLDGAFHVLYVFDCKSCHIGLELRVPGPVPVAESLTKVLPTPPCVWCEWEIKDLYGISFEGHPGKGHFILPESWPMSYHPLRKDAPPRPPAEGGASRIVRRAINKAVIPMGPYHPALHEPEYFELIVDGERVLDARYRGFFVYRGIEKLAEEKLSYDQVPLLAERICGICGFTHSIAYSQALESALGVEPPERALYLRSFLLELERIHSHLLWMAIMFHTVGFDTGFMDLMLYREYVMDAAEKITGNRKTYSMAVPGGLRRDIPEEALRSTAERLRSVVEKAVKVAEEYVEADEIRSRLEDVGVLARRDARDVTVLGPVARASGLEVDTRRDKPYAAYGWLEFNTIVEDEGDVMARFRVRAGEALESVRILEQIAREAPRGPVRAGYEPEPFRMGVGYTEAPRGENLHFVITGPGWRLWRWKVRAPSYNNIAALPLMLRGYTVADAPVIIASIDPCFSCTDRVLVVDSRTGEKRLESFRSLIRRRR